MPFPKAIITKPQLITTADYQEVGQNIALVGYDEFSKQMAADKGYASPRLINWVEPYQAGGETKTLFYTEVNTNIKAGDKVFIINGSYDSDLLIKKDKYKKGRDGYTVLKVDGCKIALDIDFTGALPYTDANIDDFIKVYYIDSEETFIAANRQLTTRGGKLDYKFNYGQNNIAFISSNQGPIEEWGRNGGAYGAPGFFVREENSYIGAPGSPVSIREQWNNISDKLVYLGSFSVAESSKYPSNGRMIVMNGSFEYNGISFKEGEAYKWNEKKNVWEADVLYSAPVISKSNFRSGTFKGKFNTGVYGSMDRKISWTGAGTWNGGTIVNSKWKDGTMNSNISISSSMRTEKDEYGIPFQRTNSANNGGFGFNYAIGCEVEKSVIQNGNFIDTKFVGHEGTFSVVEEHLLGATQSFDNEVVKAFFESCEFKNIHVKSGELKNARAFNSRFTNVKALNSYFEQSVLKDSTYIGDGVIKILGYDEWNISEYRSRTSGTYSYINTPNSKLYKFYISKESFERMKAKDTFFIKGLKIKDSARDMLIDFFDSRFRLSSWNAYYDDILGNGYKGSIFYKRGYEMAAFLSTPEENAYAISSYEESYVVSGTTRLKYRTEVVGANAKKGYSIDIIASRHDVSVKSTTLEATSDRFALIPRDYNYGTDVATATASMPNYIGDMVDISGAYVIDADFHSGIVETSDWNSGYHINYNNDVALCGPTSTGRYDMSIDVESSHLLVRTPFNRLFPEKHGEDSMLQAGDIVYLNAIDYDNRGMATSVTIMATGSSYSTTNPTSPAVLVNTTVSGTTMSATGSGYYTSYGVPTIATKGNGSGLTLDIVANPIGSVLSITYSAPLSNGGSYSVTVSTSILGYSGQGPVPTASFTEVILVDVSGSVTGVVGATYTAVGGIGQTTTGGGGVANAIFATGPAGLESGLQVRYYTLPSGAISSLSIETPGINYLKGQVFKIEGGNATFSVSSVAAGDILSYSVANPGEDYIIGDTVEIPKLFDPNRFSYGNTASLTITSVSASYYDDKGLTLDIVTGTGPLEGSIASVGINNPGLYYSGGEIFTIMTGTQGNLDALVRIDSVTGSVTRLGDTYKVVENNNGVIRLQELGTQSVIAGLTGGGVFYTRDANNRWNYISKLKIDRSKIKSGIFRRPYITRSLIRDSKYSSTDKDFQDMPRIKNLMLTDAIFSHSGNILSSATYIHSIFCAGSDIWNDGIVFRSILNGMTFSRGTVKASSWLDGTFNGGTFYASRSFNANPSAIEKNYLSNSMFLYYMKGEIRWYPPEERKYNGRYAWYNGTFNGGEFFKSDWDAGTFNGGLFYNSKFYDGTINGGIIGTKNVSAEDTRIYNGVINNTTVNNAYVYSEDTSFEGLSSSTIEWNNGVFNGGVFGSNNNRIMGYTISVAHYDPMITAIPIKDFTLTQASVYVNDTNAITSDFEIDVQLTLKHTYIGDLIINIMAPNGKIINLKKKYSGGGNDNMIQSVFTSDATAPSFDIWTAPYTGTFRFSGAIGQGVYYNLLNRSVYGPYKAATKELPAIKRYASVQPPTGTVYDGDRYLIVATAADPLWAGQTTVTNGNGYVSNQLFDSSLLNSIVEYKASTNKWIFPTDESGRVLDDPAEGDKVSTEAGETLVYYRSVWTKSYHSNTAKISDLLSADKKITGTWKILVMDDAGVDSGFLDEFSIDFKYKNSYLIRAYKNYATWRDGIFNGGQFVDLGVWKKGTFNGGKFISSYGWTSSGNWLDRNSIEESYAWQSGTFNGGEFGNESLQANSTWFTGNFNGGVFKGRLWNDGIFTYGEFKGSSKLPAAGPSLKSDSAAAFMETFRSGDYYGVWRKGTVSEKKDEFVTDKKIFTELERAAKPVVKGKQASFANMLWLGGTFNHQSGKMINSLWLEGLFKKGRFEKGAFNPFVRRYSDASEFTKDDSSIWEDGTFADGEFHYSKWMQGKFISGTAVGMIWKKGIASYMNAYNVFWEDGIWRNGNWNGSMFDFTGMVEDGFAREILNRGIEWSGTSSCHIWNLFESDSDRTAALAKSNYNSATGIFDSASLDTFATDNQDDAGVSPPYFVNPSDGILTAANYNIDSSTQITFNVRINQGGGTISHAGIVFTSATSMDSAPEPVASPVIDPNTQAVTMTPASGNTPGQSGYIAYTGTPALSSIVEENISITVPNLVATRYYSFKVVLYNKEFTATQAKTNVQTISPLIIGAYPTLSPTTPHPSSGQLSIQVAYTDGNANAPTATKYGIVYTPESSGITANLATVVNNNIQVASTTTVYNKVWNKGSTWPAGTDPQTNSFTPKLTYSGSPAVGSIVGNTKYYYQVYIQNAAGMVLSNTVGTFTTGALAPLISQFDTNNNANISTGTPTVATTQLTVKVTNRGSAQLRYGFRIYTVTAPSNSSYFGASPFPTNSATLWSLYTDTATNGDSTATLDLSSLPGLTPGTTYNVQAFAADASSPGTLYVLSTTAYKLLTSTVAPTITTIAPLNIGSTKADLKGNVSNLGGNTMTQRGFVYIKAGGTWPAIASTTAIGIDSGMVALGPGPAGASPVGDFTYTIPLNTLRTSEEYRVKSYVVVSGGGTYYGSELTFYTQTTADISSRSNTGAGTARTLSATITPSAGGGGAAGIATVLQASITTTANSYAAISTMTLTPNTKYYIRALVSNAGISSGTNAWSTFPVEWAYTLAIATAEAPADISDTTVTAAITVPGAPTQPAPSKKGIRYYKTSTPSIGTDVDFGASNTFTISTLEAGTQYTYEAFADAPSPSANPNSTVGSGWLANQSGDSGAQRTYGTMYDANNKKDFWTLASISATITFVSPFTSINVAVAGITNTGGSIVYEYGIVWKSAPSSSPLVDFDIDSVQPIVDDISSSNIKRISSGSTNASIAASTSFSQTVSIPANSKVKVVAYVKNQGGIFITGTSTFTT